MSFQKPRIIPWLEEQINSQRYPGLAWINQERTQFRIPWKHGLRQDRSEDDGKIFEAWAIASGSYNPQTDVPCPAVWKRNFRSALNRKTEIHMVQDNGSISNDPHKIYEFNRGDISAGDVTPEDLYCSNSISPFSQLPPCNSQRSQLTTVDGSLLKEIDHMKISLSEDDLYLDPENLPSSVPASAEDFYSNITSPDVFVAAASPISPDIPPYLSCQDSTGSAQGMSQEESNNAQQFPFNQLFKTFETEFDVKIYYRGALVKQTVVKNPHGFHLTSRPQVNPDNYLEDVILPPPDKIINDLKVAAEIRKLLQNLEQGTLVKVQNGTICAKRQGKCRSFWSITDMPTTDQPNQINKDAYSELYKCQQFIKELIEFMEQKRKESPQYDIWICLGEAWPDSKPWKKKLIMVQITSICMQMLHEMSYSNGASSLRSSDINLEISDSLSSSLHNKNDLLNFLKYFEEQMDCA